MLIEFEVHFECNEALFSLTLRVITPVQRDKTDGIHPVSTVFNSSLCISNLYFNLKDRFFICSP